ncbi:hypothetical protein, partial [Saccharomonospora saliphila]|uniref:hypothetical protein n=1 Tax=Saccharomonospora saliphila TaxID=369829 RepID=UPI00037FC161
MNLLRNRQFDNAVANETFSGAELDRMRQMLDNPDVSAQDRQNFLYALSNAGRLTGDEVLQYSGDVGADPFDVMRGGEALGENLDNARESLTSVERALTASEVSEIERGLNQGGFSTSDEIIDEAETALTLFDEFHPRYEEANALVGAGTPSGGSQEYDAVSLDLSSPGGTGDVAGASASYTHSGVDPRSIREGMAEFRGIDFSAFHSDAEMLTSARQTVDEVTDALGSAWENTSDWTGGAKSSAEQVNNTLIKGAGDLSQALTTAPDGITHAIDEGVQRNVINYAQNVLKVYGDGTVAELSPHQVDAFIDAVKRLPDLIAELEAKVQEIENRGLFDRFVDLLTTPLGLVVPLVGSIAPLVGYTLADNITEDNIRSELEKYRGTLREAEQKLAEFCGMYQQKANEVHGHGANYVAAIDAAYSELITYLGQLDADPFAARDGAGETVPGPGQTGAGAGAGSIPGGAGSGVPGGGSGSVPGGGGGAVPSPEDLMPDGGEQTNPVTGEPLEIDPETGEPYPIDPETGEAVPRGDEVETLTVEKGDQTFSITEPDADGAMGISVEDGSGQARDYALDFGDPEAGGADSTAGDAGTPGDDTGEPGAERVYRPGPDGKIHIEDGELALTAERPDGPDGPTVVTVDNGDGEPVTYTLGADGTDGDGSGGQRFEAAAGRAEPGPISAAQAPASPAVDGGDGGGGPWPGTADADVPGDGAEAVEDLERSSGPASDGAVGDPASGGGDPASGGGDRAG